MHTEERLRQLNGESLHVEHDAWRAPEDSKRTCDAVRGCFAHSVDDRLGARHCEDTISHLK